MNDEVTQAAKAIEGIVKAVPVYQDVVQPAAQQVGKGLETVAKTLHIALAPISVLVWGYDEIQNFVESKLSEKLKNVPKNRIQTPSPLLAGPLLESLRYVGHEETLCDLYANLLAASMDSKTAKNAHPGFVPILQSMSPDEAKILRLFSSEGSAPLIDVKKIIKSLDGFRIIIRNFSFIGERAGCVHSTLTPTYLDNLIRLGLLEIVPNRYIKSEGLYEQLQEAKELNEIKKQIEDDDDLSIGFDKKKIELTDLGKQFCSACVIDKSLQS